ncbi:MAG: hypothetical protein KF889_04845 [Alphaproteobacteria bacterium]|nr:hypothetical protein [Alphaproteobacteria bacterium]MCW5742196.1 hypothetical protein [Alphaproteobacteria bacterium]
MPVDLAHAVVRAGIVAMTKFRLTQHAFSGGVISNELAFRSDQKLYGLAVKRADNFICTGQGPALTRPGFQFRAAEPGLAMCVFRIGLDQIYLMVFRDGLMNVYRDGVVVASDVVVPWTAAQLPMVRFAQNSTWLVGFHEDVFPQRIVRGDDDATWSVGNFPITVYPYNRFPGHDAITMSASATTGSVTLTTTGDVFSADNVTYSTVFWLQEGYVQITAVASATSATGTVLKTLGSTDPDAFREQAWSPIRGYPICGVFFQERLVIGGSRDLPGSIWGSTIGKPWDFDDVQDETGLDGGPNPAADDSFHFDLSDGSANRFVDIVGGEKVSLFMSDGEWLQLEAAMSGAPDISVQFTPITAYGSLDNGIRAINADGTAMFVDRRGTLRAFDYMVDREGYDSTSLMAIAPEIITDPTATAYLQRFENNSVVVVLNGDGTFSALIFDKSTGVRAWCRIELAEGCSCVDVCTVGDDLYALIDFDEGRYLAKLVAGSYLLDLHSTATDTAKATWTGFTRFADQTVTVVGDGFTFSDVEVDETGAFTLSRAVATVVVGLPYVCELETLPPPLVIDGQSKRGERTRKVDLDLSLTETRSIHVDGRRVPLRQLGSSLLDVPPQPFTGIKRVLLNGVAAEPTLTISVRDPYPATINGITVGLDTSTAR